MTRRTLSTAIIIFLSILFFKTSNAQQEVIPTGKIVKPHYTPSGGILGAANFSNYRLGDRDLGYDNKSKIGWAGGIWANFSAGPVFSIEPQVQYSRLAAELNHGTLQDYHQEMDYISVPILLKFHAGRNLAFMLGPQFDFLSKTKNKLTEPNGPGNNKNEFKSSDIAATAGIELFPRGRLSIYGRYAYGFNKVNDNTTQPDFYNTNLQAGLKLRLFGKYVEGDDDGDGVIDSKDKCRGQAGLSRYDGCPIPDSDGDGVNDEVDKCPNQTGLAKYQGCPIPDSDKDGINDDEDKCPNQPGTAKYNGCPIPDSDGDGVNDEVDKCPNQAGLEKYQGCPIPDTDGDGINDEEDRCPNEPGVPEMKGCKQIEKFEASRVTFASGKSILTAQGKKELDIVVAFMQRAPEGMKINLVGHTDNTGTDEINNPLSIARADAAKAYIVGKGIDASRIDTQGLGSTTPIADNKTVKGRAQNRRVEVTIQ